MLAWSLIGPADQMYSLALLTFLQGMGVEESGPVSALLGGKNTGALTERAAVCQGT